MNRYTVYLGYCPHYEAHRISKIIKNALVTVPTKKPIAGKIVIKPNLVMAHPRVATESYTRSEVIGGILHFLQDYRQAIDKIDIVEKSGLGVTTSTMFRHAGYRSLAKKYGVNLIAMEEGRHARIVLKRSRLHSNIEVARQMAERDFLIFAPKLKTNVLSHGFSGALKLNIGTIDSRQRLFHHHHRLPDKIVDLLEAADPDLIVTDGVRLAFGGNQMTQRAIDLGVIVIASDAVAHDMVCAKMLDLDLDKIEHIKKARERGYGPSSFDEIEIKGDFTIEQAQKITAPLDFGYMPVDKYPCPLDIRSGSPYCVGGCHGIFLDWLHMIGDRRPGQIKRLPELTVLIGRVTDRITAKRVLLVGDCACASPQIVGNSIRRIAGCPPSHKKIVWDMLVKYFVINPLVRPSLIFDSYILYPIKKFKGWLLNFSSKRLLSPRQSTQSEQQIHVSTDETPQLENFE